MDKPDHNQKIGILGGSFNPAHAGHLEISLRALDILKLDVVWWLVSPGNPLKSDMEMATFETRMKSAQEKANDPRIIVSDLENTLGTTYTIDTLEKITEMHPEHHFVWLMGADNLAEFDQWKSWRKIATTVPFAIFNRPSYSKPSLEGIAANELAEHRIDQSQANTLYSLKPPAWVYCERTNNPMSSTEIRSKNKLQQEVTYFKVQETQELKDNLSPQKPLTTTELQELIINSLEDDKAEDVIQIDLAGKTSIADSMVIASGRSTRQVSAIANNLYRKLKHATDDGCKLEGMAKADWVLLDAGNIIIHIFRPEVRSFYNLEKMWAADFTPEKMLASSVGAEDE
jgi:nicotinate-nucleotide adenylyltransferase